MNSITQIELPATSKDLLAQSEPAPPSSLFAGVWDLHHKLYDDPDYKQYLNAYNRDMAVEGSITCDEVKAAEMIRDEAKKQGLVMIQSAKLAEIIRPLRRVMKKGNIARKQRRELAALLAAAEAANQAAGGDGE